MLNRSDDPLSRIPQIWPQDAIALRDAGIESAGEFVQFVREHGLERLSETSGIPSKSLHDYLNAVEAFLTKGKTRLRAALMLSAAIATVIFFSVWMLSVQTGLLPRSVAKATSGYADIYARYSDMPLAQMSKEQLVTLLNEVDQLLGTSGNGDQTSLSNLALLRAAVNDGIAAAELREGLQRMGGNGSCTDYIQLYESSQIPFERARDQNDQMQGNDPRISFARQSTAAAWANRAEYLVSIDLPLSSPDCEALSDAIQTVRLARLTQDIVDVQSELIYQRIDSVLSDYDSQTRTNQIAVSTSLSNLESIVSTLQDELVSVKGELESVQGELGSMQGGFRSVQEDLANLQAGVVELEPPIAQLREQMSGNESSVLGRVDAAHIDIRDALENLDTRLTSALEIIGDENPDVLTAGYCGLTNLQAVRSRLKRLCYPRGGLGEDLVFSISVSAQVESSQRVTLETLPAPGLLECNLEQILNDLDYDGDAHQCNITFQAN